MTWILGRHHFASRTVVLSSPSRAIARIVFIAIMAISCHQLAGQDISPNSHQLAYGEPPATTLIENETLRQLMQRLDAAEAEIRFLRERDVTAGIHSTTMQPMQPISFGGPGYDSGCDAGGGAPGIAAESAEFLVPLSLDCGLGEITFKPGVRIQSRYKYDNQTDNNDFFVRRARYKWGGSAFGVAKYYTELKFDSTGAFETEAAGVVENAWLDFPLFNETAFLRVGLYDVPFSRNALTSDSRLLFMDRTLIKSAITEIGMTDNTIGMLLHGRPFCGRFEYAVGIFDNVIFENLDPDGPEDTMKLMPAGRIAVNLLDPPSSSDGYADYWESYIGEGQRLQVGANFAYLDDITDEGQLQSIYAWGVDVFFNSGRWVFQAEYNWWKEDLLGGGAAPIALPMPTDPSADGWYAQGGYLLGCLCEFDVELAARHQEFNPEDTTEDRLQWTSIGTNLYMRGHNLKIQSDYTFKREGTTEVENDLFQTQLQFDF